MITKTFKNNNKNTFQVYVGIVVDNDDPAKLQRVRVRLPQYPKDMPNDCIPWASQEKPALFGMGTSGCGTVAIPALNSLVAVYHLDDQYSPIYKSIQSSTVTQITNSDDYPNVYGKQDTNGNYAKLNLIKNLIQILDASEIQINQTGDIKLKMKGNIHFCCDGLFLQAPQIHLTANDIVSNANMSVQTLDTTSVVTNDLFTTNAQASGVFQGTLKGAADYAYMAGATPMENPSPIVVPPDVRDPEQPDLDFDE